MKIRSDTRVGFVYETLCTWRGFTTNSKYRTVLVLVINCLLDSYWFNKYCILISLADDCRIA